MASILLKIAESINDAGAAPNPVSQRFQPLADQAVTATLQGLLEETNQLILETTILQDGVNSQETTIEMIRLLAHRNMLVTLIQLGNYDETYASVSGHAFVSEIGDQPA